MNHRIAAMTSNAPPINQLLNTIAAIPKTNNQIPLNGIVPLNKSTEIIAKIPTTNTITALSQPNVPMWMNDAPKKFHVKVNIPKYANNPSIPSMKTKRAPMMAITFVILFAFAIFITFLMYFVINF
jgi:hypothetical protein